MGDQTRLLLAEVLARQADALLLPSATPHDGCDRWRRCWNCSIRRSSAARAALAEGESALGQPCRRFNFTEGTAEVEDADVKALLQEVDSALNRFENVAKTYKWLGDEGAAADEISQRQAKRALEIGQKVGEVDLVAFVEGAVLAEGGRVARHEHWLDIYPPSNWTHGLDELPGWNGTRLRLTRDLDRLTDDKDEPVGFLGRAHPLVRRAIEHVRHLSLGQRDGYDVRVSAAKSSDGKPALLFTFLGRVQSQAGRELERVIAVRVTQDLQTEVITEETNWLPKSSEGVATKGLWEREFKSWGEQARAVAEAAAQKAIDEITTDFVAKHEQQIEQERRELNAWLTQRVDEIVGRSEQALPLFHGLSDESLMPIERLTEFVTQAGRTSRERNEAQTMLTIYQVRTASLHAHLALTGNVLLHLGLIMII